MPTDSVAFRDDEHNDSYILRSIDVSRLPAIKAGFYRRGESVRSWAHRHGFKPTSVYNVLTGKRLCLRGEQHRIAVALGLKDGSVSRDA